MKLNRRLLRLLRLLCQFTYILADHVCRSINVGSNPRPSVPQHSTENYSATSALLCSWSLQVQILKGSGYTESSGVDPLTNYNGDWSYDESAGMITYLISHRERGGIGADVKYKDIDVDIKMEK